MKMTRMEWRYLQRIALNHPYFDTHKLPLTEKEAKTIVEANNTMTGREFVDSIYAKLGMTRPEEKKDRFAWLHNIGELFTVPPIRKIAIAVLAVVLMAVFFTATQAGRSIAESVIHYIATLFDDDVVTVNRSDNEDMVIPLDVEPNFEEDELLEQNNNVVYINVFEEFTAATGIQPKVLPYPHAEVYYDYDRVSEYLQLNVVYKTTKGMIATYQIWNSLDLVSFTPAGLTIYDSDPSIYYSFENNGMISIMKVYDDSIFGIIAEDSYSLDELIILLTSQ